ncbi:MAG: hypothetical protein WCK05_16205, partial [Planctomycetota bacterium]
PVAVVDKVVDRRGTRLLAEAYLNFWYTEEAQDIAARNFYRPRSEKALAKCSGQFAHVTLFTIDEVFGGWGQAHRLHFADGGVFDRIYSPAR